MDYRNLFGIASIILSIAVLILSFNTANAIPQGANISIGSNPVASFTSTNCTSGDTVVSVPSDQILVITDIIIGGYYGEDVQLKTGTGTLLGQFKSVNGYSQAAYNHFLEGRFYSLRSGIVVPSGEDLVLYCGSNSLTVSGYYAHP